MSIQRHRNKTDAMDNVGTSARDTFNSRFTIYELYAATSEHSRIDLCSI